MKKVVSGRFYNIFYYSQTCHLTNFLHTIDYVNCFHIYNKLSQNGLLIQISKAQLNLKCFKILAIRWYRTKKTDFRECKKDKGQTCQNLEAYLSIYVLYMNICMLSIFSKLLMQLMQPYLYLHRYDMSQHYQQHNSLAYRRNTRSRLDRKQINTQYC